MKSSSRPHRRRRCRVHRATTRRGVRRRYLIMMGIRIVCFILMVVITPYGWYTWVLGAAAIVPALHRRGASRTSVQNVRRTGAENPERALPAAPSATPQPSLRRDRLRRHRGDARDRATARRPGRPRVNDPRTAPPTRPRPRTAHGPDAAPRPRWRIEWRNPRIHSADRRKIWVACDEHRDYPARLPRGARLPRLGRSRCCRAAARGGPVSRAIGAARRCAGRPTSPSPSSSRSPARSCRTGSSPATRTAREQLALVDAELRRRARAARRAHPGRRRRSRPATSGVRSTLDGRVPRRRAAARAQPPARRHRGLRGARAVPARGRSGAPDRPRAGCRPGEDQPDPDVVPAPPEGEVTVIARLRPGEPLPASGRSAPEGQVPTINLAARRRRHRSRRSPMLELSAYGLMVVGGPGAGRRARARSNRRPRIPARTCRTRSSGSCSRSWASSSSATSSAPSGATGAKTRGRRRGCRDDAPGGDDATCRTRTRSSTPPAAEPGAHASAMRSW